ncbi:MAG: 8-amino-7-oxononanoate synthase [Chrysiogenetes bacterium]|nr:8-amino-7-oxononanoate synthase [Chrysiogenetes bacterium]
MDASVRLRDEATGEAREVGLFCSNNYLGLASHPRLKHAAIEATRKYGVGSGASRHISGTFSLHEELEAQLAAFKRTERAVVYNTGFMANVGIISALMGSGDAVFSDELNHASIIDGCRLSGAQKQIFRHRDMNHLEELLRSSKARHKLVVTDTVFSMDGDFAPLPEIVALAERYGAWTMVDEAHATGCIGEGGRGAVEYFGLTGRVDIIMGTLGKALGSFGAFAAGSSALIEHLINRSRMLIFTTAHPPAVLAASSEALRVVSEEPGLRAKLAENGLFLREGLRKLGFSTLDSRSQIVPIVIGEAAPTMEFARRLLAEGVFVTGIRPPTVPEGTCRLRATVMASHTGDQLSRALTAFESIGKDLGVL